MAYGELRLLPTNLITASSMITPSSQATGQVSGVVKDGAGVARLTVTGSFAAELDLFYTILIDSVAGGVENGEATFKWRTSENDAGVYEESGIATRATPAYALSADGLGGGLSVAWTGNVGDDFAVDDEFTWWAKAGYGPGKLLDLDRNTYWKATGDTSEQLVIDLGGATQVTASILADHNLTSGATVKFQGNASDAWGGPSVDYTFATITDPLIYYHDNTYRYWRWDIADAANPDTYVKVGQTGLYDYTELEHPNADWGSSEILGVMSQQNKSIPGVQRDFYHAQQRQWTLAFKKTLSNADIDTLIAVQEALLNSTTNRIDPMWVHWFSDDVDYLRFVHWQNINKFSRNFSSYLLNSRVELELDEVVKV